jgi:hypothetical protein
MKMSRTGKTIVALGLALGFGGWFTGCGSTDDGGSVSGSMYYGAGFYDPWYYGGHYDDIDVIVTPPDRPDHPAAPPRPTHPIATPPTPRPMPMPMPSIPTMPRVSPRR